MDIYYEAFFSSIKFLKDLLENTSPTCFYEAHRIWKKKFGKMHLISFQSFNNLILLYKVSERQKNV